MHCHSRSIFFPCYTNFTLGLNPLLSLDLSSAAFFWDTLAFTPWSYSWTRPAFFNTFSTWHLRNCSHYILDKSFSRLQQLWHFVCVDLVLSGHLLCVFFSSPLLVKAANFLSVLAPFSLLRCFLDQLHCSVWTDCWMWAVYLVVGTQSEVLLFSFYSVYCEYVQITDRSLLRLCSIKKQDVTQNQEPFISWNSFQ